MCYDSFMYQIGLTDHIEAPLDYPATKVYQEAAEFVALADSLGVGFAWFAEHHAHVHHGHLPTPLLFALHLLGKTKQIHLGSAIICLNLHDPIDIAEQVAVADVLGNGRLAPGFGSGSTPEEAAIFGKSVVESHLLHEQFERSLTQIQEAWRNRLLPTPAADLHQRCWIAVNSVGSAAIAGRQNFNILFSHLRTLDQYQEYASAYHNAGGRGQIAINRPVHVAADDQTAWARAQPAIERLYKRFQSEGKIAGDCPTPRSQSDWCAHPLNFLIGSPQTIVAELDRIHRRIPFTVANLEMRWADLPEPLVHESLRLLMAHLNE